MSTNAPPQTMLDARNQIHIVFVPFDNNNNNIFYKKINKKTAITSKVFTGTPSSFSPPDELLTNF